MSRPTSARPRVEELEAREVPALGLDPTFGTGGLALNLGGDVPQFASVAAVAVAPGGKTVIVGTTVGSLPYGGGGDLAVVRLTAAGKPDAQFGGGDGVATLSYAPYPQPAAVTIQSDGKILVAGDATPFEGLAWDGFVVRLNADGTRDAGFGTDGAVHLDFGGGDTVGRIAVQADGKIVVAGTTASTPEYTDPYSYQPPEARLVLERLNANGTPDVSFGTAGRVTGAAGSGSWTNAGLAVQPDGKLVVGGHLSFGGAYGTTTELEVRRFGAGGAPDTSFGTGGRAATTYGSFLYAYANDMVLLPDGQIVVGGGSSYGQGLLAWFGPGGALISQEQFSWESDSLQYISRLLPMPGGGVMASNGGAFEYHAAPGSSVDVTTVRPGAGFVSGGVAVGPDGRLVVAGASTGGIGPFAPPTPGGPVGAFRLADPGVTESPTTFVAWTTGPEFPSGTVNLTADVLPQIGPAAITEGTLTFREGNTVLGTVQAGATWPSSPWIPFPGTYPPVPVYDAPLFVTVTLPPGEHTITAEYSGTARWAASSATATFRVSQPVGATATLVVSNPAPFAGESVVLTATLARTDGVPFPPPQGTVTFFDGDTPIGTGAVLLNGLATMETAPLTAGAHAFRAVYAGELGFTRAESAPVAVTAAAHRVETTTALTATAPVAVVGAPFTLTARVREAGGVGAVAGGTVTFTDGTTVLGTAPVGAGGVATLTTTLRLGTRTLRAAYSGGAGALASNSQPLSVAVGKAPTATSLATSTQTFIPGQVIEMIASVRITAGSAFPVGAVEFRDGSRVLGTGYLDGRGQARHTFAVTAGTHALTAVYLGCSTCDASTSAAVAFTAGGRVSTATTLAAAVAAPVFGQPQTLTARVTGATAGRVNFFDGQTLIGSAAVGASGTAALTFNSNLGAHRYRAVFAGTDFADTSASGWMSQTVAKATPTVTLSVTADGSVRATVRAPYAGSPIGTVTFKSGNVVLGTVSVDGNGIATFRPAGRLAPGTYRVTAVYSGSSCFLGSTSDPFELIV